MSIPNSVPVSDLLYERRLAQAYMAQPDEQKVFPKPIVTEVTPLKGF